MEITFFLYGIHEQYTPSTLINSMQFIITEWNFTWLNQREYEIFFFSILNVFLLQSILFLHSKFW